MNSVKVISKEKKEYLVTQETLVEVVGSRRDFKAWYWWVLSLILFYPMLIVLLFWRDLVIEVKIDGEAIELDKLQWDLLNSNFKCWGGL